MIFAAGSPQEAWRVFESRYAVKSEHEREKKEYEWNEVRQKEGENINSFYGRAKAMRMELESYGDKLPDASMCKHIARRMLQSFKYVVTTCFSFPIVRVVPWTICPGELLTSWSAMGDQERRERTQGMP